jgi:hypothetical protein
MWYAAYLIKQAAGGRPPVAVAAAGGMRPHVNIPASAQANALAGQRAFAMRGTAAAPGINPTLLKLLVGGAGFGLGYMGGGPLGRELMPDGSHKLPGAEASANDPASRINREMEEKRRMVQNAAPVEQPM